MTAWSRIRRLIKPVVPKPIRDLHYWCCTTRDRIFGVRWLKRNAPEVYRRLKRSDLPEGLQEYLVKRILMEDYKRLAEPSLPTEPIDTDVLYVTENPVPDIVKEVIALKRVNPNLHCTVLTPTLLRQGALYHRYFDRIVSYSGGVELINRIRTARAKVVVPTRRGYWEGILTRLFFDGRVVFRPSEFHMALGGDDPSAVSLLGERYLLEHSDAVFHDYDVRVTDWLRETYAITGPIVWIPPACVAELGPHRRLPKLSEKDGKVHLVFAASLPRRGGGERGETNRYPVHHLDKFRIVVEQKLHLHFYHPFLDESHTPPGIEPYFQLARESPYFHIERGLSYDELLVELTKYDWAFHHSTMTLDLPGRPRHALTRDLPGDFCPNRWGDVHVLDHRLPNSVWTYVQAGLPLICSPTDLQLRRLVEKHNIGLVVHEKKLFSLRRHLEQLPTGGLVERLQSARDKFELDHVGLHALLVGRKAERSVSDRHLAQRTPSGRPYRWDGKDMP